MCGTWECVYCMVVNECGVVYTCNVFGICEVMWKCEMNCEYKVVYYEYVKCGVSVCYGV